MVQYIQNKTFMYIFIMNNKIGQVAKFDM